MLCGVEPVARPSTAISPRSALCRINSAISRAIPTLAAAPEAYTETDDPLSPTLERLRSLDRHVVELLLHTHVPSLSPGLCGLQFADSRTAGLSILGGRGRPPVGGIVTQTSGSAGQVLTRQGGRRCVKLHPAPLYPLNRSAYAALQGGHCPPSRTNEVKGMRHHLPLLCCLCVFVLAGPSADACTNLIVTKGASDRRLRDHHL